MLVARRDDDVDAARFPFGRIEPTVDVPKLPTEEYLPLALAVLYHLRWKGDPLGLARELGYCADPGPWQPDELRELCQFAQRRMTRMR